jgi:hypothetical protein
MSSLCRLKIKNLLKFNILQYVLRKANGKHSKNVDNYPLKMAYNPKFRATFAVAFAKKTPFIFINE